MDELGTEIPDDDTVRVLASIPVAGLQRGADGWIPRKQAIDLAQGGWVTILDDVPKGEPSGLQGLRTHGMGDGNDADPARQPVGWPAAGGADDPPGGSHAG